MTHCARLLTLSLLLATTPLTAFTMSEQALADLLTKEQAGEVTWLETDKEKRLGFYRMGTPSPADFAFLLMHDTGAHLYWPNLIRPMINDLSDKGTTVLSVYLPEELTMRQEEERQSSLQAIIASGVKILTEKGAKKTIVAAHGQTAHAVLDLLSSESGLNVDGLVMINLRPHASAAYPIPASLFDAIDIPMLDLVGEINWNSIKHFGDARSHTKRTKPDLFRTIQIPGGDHYLTGQSETVIERIRGWLQTFTMNQVAN